MSKFLKIVNSNNFINTINKEEQNQKYEIKNQPINLSSQFKKVDIKELEKTLNNRFVIANMVFV